MPSQAHPGHNHPDDVDEFASISIVDPAASKNFDIGGVMILAWIAACLGFSLFQKERWYVGRCHA